MIIKTEHWVMPLVFLAVSIPSVLLLQSLGWGGEYKLWIAIVVAGVSTSVAQSLLRARAQGSHS